MHRISARAVVTPTMLAVHSSLYIFGDNRTVVTSRWVLVGARMHFLHSLRLVIPLTDLKDYQFSLVQLSIGNPCVEKAVVMCRAVTLT